MGKPYREEYVKHVQESEPKEDFEDRNALYALYGTINFYLGKEMLMRLKYSKFHVLLSIMYPEDPQFRVT